MRKLPPKLIMIIAFGAMCVVFATTMLVITLIQNKIVFEAVDDAATTAEDTAATIKILDNDTSEDPADITIKTFTQPGHGYVIKYTEGLRYTPYSNYNGSDEFTYTIQNAAGDESTATVSMTVTPVNDTPKTYDDYVTCDMNATIVIDVLANDNDPDGDALTVVSYTHPEHGTVVITEDHKISYAPDAGYVGSDTFTYEIEDPAGSSDRGRVTVNVDDAG